MNSRAQRTRNHQFRITNVTEFQKASLEFYGCVGMGYFTQYEDGQLNLYGWVRHRNPILARTVGEYLGAEATPCGGILPQIIELYSDHDDYIERGWRPYGMIGGRSLVDLYENHGVIRDLINLGMEDEIEKMYPMLRDQIEEMVDDRKFMYIKPKSNQE